jgi:O-antigen/teichoic acid export membrane protein
MSLKAQAMAGIRWTTLSSMGRAVLQVAQVVVLARLLTPGDFGLVALVSATTAFLQIFADAGVSNAIIHEQDISPEQLSSLYWFNVCISAALALTLALCSPLLAAWYGQPPLTALLLMAAATLLVNALAQQLKIQTQKRLDFQRLAKVELLSAICGFVVAITLAWQSAGAYALMAGTLSTAVASTLLAWLTLAQGWRPQARLQLGEIRRFIRFGLYMIGNNLANTFNSQIDIFLGSKLLGATSVGLYSVPKELTLRVAGLINPIMTQVAFPVMAKAQNDEALLRRIYLQILRMTASVNFPIYVFIGIFSEDIVNIIFGSMWHETVPLLQILAAWALLRSTINPVGSLLMACGRADISFKWNTLLLGLMPISVFIGSQYGISGMATAMTGTMIATYWPNWRFQVYPLCKATLLEYSLQFTTPLILSIISGLACFFISANIKNGAARIIASVAIYTIIYMLFSYKFNHALYENISSLSRLNKSK